MLPRLLNFKQVQEYLQIGRDSLLNILHSGELKGFKIKGRWRVQEDDLIEFMNRLRGNANFYFFLLLFKNQTLLHYSICIFV